MALEYIEPPATQYANVLLVGPPKSGKTTGAASAPGVNAYLNCDLPNAISFAYSRNTDTMFPVKWQGFATLNDLALLVMSEDRPDCVTIDPIGELYRLCLEDLSNRAISPSLPIYQAVSVRLERFYRHLCEAPVNVVFVAHDFPVKDEATGDVLNSPYTGTQNPALGRKLMGMVDIIGSCGVMIDESDPEPKYVAQLLQGKGRVGGDRFNKLGNWRELDLTEWFVTIGVHTTKTDQEMAA